MAGHSKWANIKHRKQAVDAKRGKAFTKLAKEITIAVKIGGPDEDNNPRLKSAIIKAKQANLPRDNIDRAIKRGSGELGFESYEEIVYEGYGPGGVAVIVEAMTDKKSRTLPQIKSIFAKSGGSLAEAGAVSYQFIHKGVILVEGDISLDSIFEYAIDSGAEDIEKDENTFVIQTSKEDFHEILTNLTPIFDDKNLTVVESGLKYIPQTLITLEDQEEIEKLEKLVQTLENHDDVQSVYNNLAY